MAEASLLAARTHEPARDVSAEGRRHLIAHDALIVDRARDLALARQEQLSALGDCDEGSVGGAAWHEDDAGKVHGAVEA